MSRDRIKAALYGAAFGDAMGAPTEFVANATLIEQRFPPSGPTEPTGDPARVTDDTQMMLAVGKAIGRARRGESLEQALRMTFVTWLNDPDNNRAPGNTCLRACMGLERGLLCSIMRRLSAPCTTRSGLVAYGSTHRSARVRSISRGGGMSALGRSGRSRRRWMILDQVRTHTFAQGMPGSQRRRLRLDCTHFFCTQTIPCVPSIARW